MLYFERINILSAWSSLGSLVSEMLTLSFLQDQPLEMVDIDGAEHRHWSNVANILYSVEGLKLGIFSVERI